MRTFVVACLVGDALKDIAKGAGIQIGKGLTKSLINQIPGKVLIEINKKVGFRLITKAGEKGAINLVKRVPFVGGIVGVLSMQGLAALWGKTRKSFFTEKGRFRLD
ncbi:MAG: hypothetical protein AB1671_07855 [Thermodesulfobacteriota bacterium]